MKAEEVINQLAQKFGFPKGLVHEVIYEFENVEDLNELGGKLNDGQSYATMVIGFYPQEDSILIGVPWIDGSYYGSGDYVDRRDFLKFIEDYKSFLNSGNEIIWKDVGRPSYFIEK